MSESAQTTDRRPRALGGARKLTLVDAIAQSVGFMGPVFSIAFLVPLLVGIDLRVRQGRPASRPRCRCCSRRSASSRSRIVAQYAATIHAAGSLYDYVTDGLGATLGACDRTTCTTSASWCSAPACSS